MVSRAEERPPPDDYDDSGALLGGLISKDDNPYVTSSAERLRKKYGEERVSGSSQPRELVEASLAARVGTQREG